MPGAEQFMWEFLPEKQQLSYNEDVSLKAAIQLAIAYDMDGLGTGAAVPSRAASIGCDVVFVVDVSDSMSGEPIANVQTAYDHFVSGAAGTFNHAQDRLCVIAFGSEVNTLVRFEDSESMRRAVTFEIQGTTNMMAGMDTAFAILAQRSEPERRCAIYLLTDGQPDGSKDELVRRVTQQRQDLRKRQPQAIVAMFAIGFGESHDAQLLRRLSSDEDDMYIYAEQPADAITSTGFLAETLRKTIVVREARFQIRETDRSAFISAVHAGQDTNTVPPPGDTEGQPWVVTLKNLAEGALLHIIVEVDLEPVEGKRKAGAVCEAVLELLYQDGTREQITKPLMISREIESSQPNLHITDQVARVQTGKALTAAADALGAGNFAEAENLLKDGRDKVTKLYPETRSPAASSASSTSLNRQSAAPPAPPLPPVQAPLDPKLGRAALLGQMRSCGAVGLDESPELSSATRSILKVDETNQGNDPPPYSEGDWMSAQY